MAEFQASATLRDSLQGKVAAHNDPDYLLAQNSYFSAQARSLFPGCIATPTTNTEVATIVKMLVEGGVKFAIRGGGHSLNAGAANIESGVTINLRALNKTLVSLEAAQNGARFTLSYMCQEGLVCDNVENYEVVLADGSLVNANHFENRNLWQALKGGSNNYGIVTRFDIRTFPQENFLGGYIVHDISTLDSQLKGFTDLLENFDPYAAMSISWNQKRNGYSIFNNLEYTKNDTNPRALKPNQFATTTFGGSLEFLQNVHSIRRSSIHAISSIVGVNWAMTIQPLPIAAMNQSEKVNSLGLSSSSGPLTLFLLSYNWENIEDDEEITLAAKKLISDIDEAARERGVGSDFKYLNYAASWQNPLGGYGELEETLKKLRDTGEIYDPGGVFQTLCEGGFKISKA
ncbi:uncharacterized protein EAF02_007565 [Botrytis sinoallii]|uniref:uncharacterized protein n=1 Tax=Botrytis sinoallii TaxID=1463999 RepID=UPI0018FF8595|nr:uncharacterized protein EAF02_007565 [Botrytis sinoallii]KAF7879928.1 hypothetical protein EAF02_007565 [Botrytis sinoallii]